jgi:hypothetical protein
MKFATVILFSLTGCVTAGLPKLSFTVQDGKFDDLNGLNPTLSWSNTNELGDVDVEYGIEADARVTSDYASLPNNIWGKLSSKVGGWGVSARAEVKGEFVGEADIDLVTSHDEEDFDLQFKGYCNGTGCFVEKIQATKGFNYDGGKLTVQPSYNVDSEETDVVLTYVKTGTLIKVEASPDAQVMTLSKQLDAENRVAPTFSNNGDVSIEWEHTIGDDSAITTTFKPQEWLNVDFSEGGWNAHVHMPLDGTDISGAKISIKKDITF